VTKIAMKMITRRPMIMPMIITGRVEPLRVFLAADAAVGTDEETEEEDLVVVDGKLLVITCGVLTVTLDIWKN